MNDKCAKKVLLLGGTGAMGIYLTPELLKMGYEVTVVSLDDRISDDSALTYIKANGKDEEFLTSLLKNGYDAIVDFLIYGTEEFRARYKLLLSNTAHYILLSSYRVYADSAAPITEKSARLLDVSDDAEFLAAEDYSLYKAREEDIVSASGFDNWTAIRPAITYSKFRFQLVTLEANVHMQRIAQGKTVVIPEAAMEIQSTMSWAGDVAKLISRLVLNKRAYCEKFTVSTAEHNPWGDVAKIYESVCGMKYVTSDIESFLNIVSPGNKFARWQLMYDRMFNRVMDNRKVLDVTGLKQSDFTLLRDGIKREFDALPKGYVWGETDINLRMDRYLAERGGI